MKPSHCPNPSPMFDLLPPDKQPIGSASFGPVFGIPKNWIKPDTARRDVYSLGAASFLPTRDKRRRMSLILRSSLSPSSLLRASDS